MAEPLLSELIAELKREGLLLNNLFQLDNGSWRASVRSLSQQTGYHFYDHPNPAAAVRGAILQVQRGGTAIKVNQPKVSGVTPTKIKGNLLQALGLKNS